MRSQRSKNRFERGQSIVLMAFTAAIVAFTLFTTFSIGKAVKERIQLQQAADASAYSLAVMEARAFNFYAYTNRAIVSHYVAMMAIYGHMSFLAYYEGALYNTASQWGCSGYGDWFTSIEAELIYEWAGWCGICADPFGGEWACPMCMGDSFDCVPQEMEWIDGTLCPKLTQEIQNVDQQLGKGSSGPSGACFRNLHDIADEHRRGANVQIGPLNLGTGFSDILVSEQEEMDARVLWAIKGQEMTKEIAQQFDPNYGAGKDTAHAALVSAINIVGIPTDKDTAGYCAVDGTSPGPVTSAGCELLMMGKGETSLSTQQQAANASRYGPGPIIYSGNDWLRDRPDGVTNPFNLYILKFVNPPVMRDTLLIKGTGMSRETVDPTKKGNNVGGVAQIVQNGCSGVGASSCNGNSSHQGGSSTGVGTQGGGSTSLAAEDHGSIISDDLECASHITFGFEYSDINVAVYSAPKNSPVNGGQSRVMWADGSTSDTADYDIGGKYSSGGGGNQYGLGLPTINFNPTDTASSLFNQPHTWAAVTKSWDENYLTQSQSGRDAFNSNDQGISAMKRTLSLNNGTDRYTYNNSITDSSVKGREFMLAIAQGLTYYHRPGDWQEPPNFYNPFWRAKLHPIEMNNGGNTVESKADYAAVAIAAGYDPKDAAELALLPITE